jgi:predicted dehydrogenase
MLRIAGVGLGDLGRFELGALSGFEGVEVVAGADPSPAAREAFVEEFDVAAYATHEDLLDAESPGAVCVVTPHTLHYEHARACLDRGVSVHLEKPMVTDLDHARDLVRRAEENDATLAVGYQRHFDPRFRAIRRAIDEGRIGTPHAAACHLEQIWISAVEDTWRTNPALSGGGQLYDSGSHLLDALLWCTRSEPVAVAAAVDERGHDVDVNSALAATLARDGTRILASIAVTGAGQSAPDPGEGLRVWGTEGSVSFDGRTITVVEDGRSRSETPEAPTFAELTRRKLANFVGAVRGEAELAIPASDAVAVTALTEAAYRAAETGRTVAVDAGVDVPSERA